MDYHVTPAYFPILNDIAMGAYIATTLATTEDISNVLATISSISTQTIKSAQIESSRPKALGMSVLMHY